MGILRFFYLYRVREVFDYWDLDANYIGAPNYTRYFDSGALVPWLYDDRSGVVISYDDVESLTHHSSLLSLARSACVPVSETSLDLSVCSRSVCAYSTVTKLKLSNSGVCYGLLHPTS